MRICMNLDEFYDIVFQINEVNESTVDSLATNKK